MKKILFTSDNHCGHRAGLTPPEFQSGGQKWVRRQVEKWEWYLGVIKDYGPFHCHVSLGDIVDGIGVKDSSETIMSTDDQVLAAIKCVEAIDSPVNWFVHGTRVHTTTRDGKEIDLEVARHVNGKENPMIHGQIWLSYGSWILDCRHAPGSKTTVYTSRGMPLAKEYMIAVDWHRKGWQPLPTHIFRGHVHQSFNAGEPGRWAAYAVPPIQDPSTKFGRMLSNIVDCGMGVLTINKKGWPTWEVIEAPPQKAQTYSLFKRPKA